MLATDIKSVNFLLLFCFVPQISKYCGSHELFEEHNTDVTVLNQMLPYFHCSLIYLWLWLWLLTWSHFYGLSLILLIVSLCFQMSRSSFAKDWRLSLFSYKYIWVSHIMSTRTASLTSSSITSWVNWGLNLQKKKGHWLKGVSKVRYHTHP